MSTKPKILYVDDEPINLLIFDMNFKEKYHVMTAEGASKGLEILDSNKDVVAVISDMRMPVMDGIEFITIAKEKHSAIHYYILTSFDTTDRIQEALNDRLIIEYFNKPLNKNEIDSSLTESLGKL